jgi:hypothetical protein
MNALGLKRELQKLDESRLSPEGEIELAPGDALAAAVLIDHTLDSGNRVTPELGEAGAMWQVIFSMSVSAPLSAEVSALRDALAAQLGIGTDPGTHQPG